MLTRFFKARNWLLISLTAVLVLAQIWMDIRIPEYMEAITDSFLLEDTDTVIQNGWAMIGCALVSLLLSVMAGFVLANMSASVGKNIRTELFDKVQSFSVADIDRFSAASLITRSTNDVTQIQNFIARGLQATIKCPILAVWAISKIYGSSIEWTAVTVAGIAVLVVVMSISLHYARKRFEKIQWLTDDVNRETREIIDGIRVIRAFNAEEHQEGKFAKANDNLLENNLSAARIMAPTMPIAQSMMNFVTIGIYWVGMSLIAAASLEETQLLLFSDMIVFTSYATMVLSAFMQVFGILRMLPRTTVGIRRVEEVVDTVPGIRDGDKTEGPETGTVEFRNVSFSYPDSSSKVLEGISFSVGKGETLAIIGTTGSGKTTLVNLIARFYDAAEGEVLVDGLDVKEYTLKSLRTRLGYGSQSAIIVSGSVGMNVNYGYGSEGRTEEDVWRALRIAQADDFVSDLPDKEKSVISQHGKNLSGGQKQRVSIARALCRSPEILILDDTFSALDYKTDFELRSSLRREMEGVTKIIVAQRVGTIMDADEILVLDRGRIVGKGKHRDLLRSCPEYYELAASQNAAEAVRWRKKPNAKAESSLPEGKRAE